MIMKQNQNQIPPYTSVRPDSVNSNNSTVSGSYDPTTLPLFGEYHPWERTLNLILPIVSTLTVILAVVVSLCRPSFPPKESAWINFCLSLCAGLFCGSNAVLAHWYREGDLEPKVRKVIYFNTVVVFLICFLIILHCFLIKPPK